MSSRMLMHFRVSTMLRGLKRIGNTKNDLQEKGLSRGCRQCAHDVDLQLLASGVFPGAPNLLIRC